MKLSPWEPDLKTVVGRIDDGDIDLQPEFQRQEIWPVAKKRRLIDTIIRGWSIPPIFLVVVAEGRMDVLDGQQRLAAIRDFIHNDFAVDGSITPLDDSVSALNGMFYKMLPAGIRRTLDQYTLRCFKITDYRPDEPSELFYRLNQPTMLTAGEQRNAFFGPAREQLKRLVEKFEKLGNNKSTIGFSNARLAYDDIIARLLVFLEAATFGIKGTESTISQRFKERAEFGSHVYRTAELAIERFSVARSVAESMRLNKASSLSWLLFFARFDADEEPNSIFMAFFSDLKSRPPEHSLTSVAVDLFHDRSSLRVTDVSSVVYRDFVLWLIYLAEFHGHPPRRILADEVLEITNTAGPANFQEILASYLNLQRWSRLA